MLGVLGDAACVHQSSYSPSSCLKFPETPTRNSTSRIKESYQPFGQVRRVLTPYVTSAILMDYWGTVLSPSPIRIKKRGKISKPASECEGGLATEVIPECPAQSPLYNIPFDVFEAIVGNIDIRDLPKFIRASKEIQVRGQHLPLIPLIAPG